MRKKELISTFEKLGVFLEQLGKTENMITPAMPWLEDLNKEFFRPMASLVTTSHYHNPWFTEENVRYALEVAGRSLNTESLARWLSCYGEPVPREKQKNIAVVMAGNIPIVGFHDMLCVLISGHRLTAKLSSKDDRLLKTIAELIQDINKQFKGKIIFEEGTLKDFDAVIATGSDNTARYFEYYFGRYPNIIRKNRNSAAILDGSETKEDLNNLAADVFRYFGLGCRSVSKLYVPRDYDFEPLVETFGNYSYLGNHNQWANNYEYQRAIHLIDKIPHIDTGFFVIRENSSLSSPVSVLNYEKYDHPESLFESINKSEDKLQCITGKQQPDERVIPFGKAQEPDLDDYADNIDTLDFLLKLK